MSNGKNILVELKDVKKEFITAKTFFGKPLKTVHAVDQVNLSIYEGETIGVVGESGCGKSTLGRSILRLINPTAGQVFYRGADITKRTDAPNAKKNATYISRSICITKSSDDSFRVNKSTPGCVWNRKK